MLRVSVAVSDDTRCGVVVSDDTRCGVVVTDDVFCSVAEVLSAELSVVAFSSAAIGDVSSSVVEVVLSGAVVSLTSDYALGMTITVNGSPATISSATLQSGSTTIRFVLSAAVDADDVVAFAYDETTGDLQDGNGVDVADIAATAVTNYVGGHLYFDESADAVHIASV